MSGNNTPEPIQANLFHAGSTCPFCQENVAEGQLIIKCDRCGAVHHETCWGHNQGCASYHCDEKVRRDAQGMQPELVITAGDLENVTPMPARRAPQTSLEATRPFLPEKPEKLSSIALAAATISTFSLVGVAGAVTASSKLLALSIGVGIVAVVTGVVAMVMVNNSRKVHGMMPAAGSVVLAAFMIIFSFISIEAVARSGGRRLLQDMSISGNMPSEAELSRMDPVKADALRANVVIHSSTMRGLIPGQTYGSGIIFQVTGSKAYIITNKHVVGEGKEDAPIDILFYNGESSKGSLEWRAPGSVDIAIVCCQALTLKHYRPLRINDFLAGQGDAVFAVGNPMNLAWSYTAGVISGIRKKQESNRRIEIYQTQTPINHGNSGGGLYDMAGRLIGVNTWTKDKSVAEGLSFAISTKTIIELLREGAQERLLRSMKIVKESQKEPAP